MLSVGGAALYCFEVACGKGKVEGRYLCVDASAMWAAFAWCWSVQGCEAVP